MELDPEALAYEVKRAVRVSGKEQESVLGRHARHRGRNGHVLMQVDSSGLPTHPLTRMLCVEIEKGKELKYAMRRKHLKALKLVNKAMEAYSTADVNSIARRTRVLACTSTSLQLKSSHRKKRSP